MFFATASAEAGWDVQLSFMTRRGKAHDDAETSARLTPEAHAAAYEGCAPGATIDKVWGALERGRVVSAAETDAREVAREADDTSDVRRSAFDDGANVLRVKTSADVRGRSCRPAPFTAMVTLRVDRVEFAAPPRRFGRSGDPTDVRDAAAVDGPDPDCWLVFDMAYDATMTDAEHGGLSRQITMCVAANKRAKVPFRLAVVADGTLAEPNASRANENERENEAASSRRVTLKKKTTKTFSATTTRSASRARPAGPAARGRPVRVRVAFPILPTHPATVRSRVRLRKRAPTVSGARFRGARGARRAFLRRRFSPRLVFFSAATRARRAPRRGGRATKNTTTNKEHRMNTQKRVRHRGGSFTSPRMPRTRSRRSNRVTSSCSEAWSITLRNRRSRGGGSILCGRRFFLVNPRATRPRATRWRSPLSGCPSRGTSRWRRTRTCRAWRWRRR